MVMLFNSRVKYRLASFCCNTKVVAPSFLPQDDSTQTQADIMKLELESALRLTGLPGGVSVCFFLKDNLIMSDEILIHINEVLEGDFEFFSESDAVCLSHHVLFDAQSRVKIIEEMKNEYRQQGGETVSESEATDAELWMRFTHRARANLHLLFCLDTQAGLACLSDFPILTNKCVINVLPAPDADARLEIVRQKLATMEFHEDQRAHERVQYSVTHAMTSFYNIAQEIGLDFSMCCGQQSCVSLSSHLDLVNHFVKTRECLTLYIDSRIELLQKCISRVKELREKGEQVALNRSRWGREIAQANRDVEELVVVLGQQSTILDAANENHKILDEKARLCNEELNRANAQWSEARVSVEPGFKGASADLKLLDRVLLGELKSYNTPPPAVERVMCIAIILSTPASKGGTWDLSWPRAKRTISSADRFVMDLLQVDPENINEERLDAVKPYLVNTAQFTPIIQEVSEVLGIVWDWMIWFFEYVTVYRERIVPLEKERDRLQQALDAENSVLQTAMLEAKRIEQEITTLSAKFENASSRKSKLQQNAKLDMERHENATSLIGKLEGEVHYWEEEVLELVQQKETMLGDSLAGSAFLAYSGPLSQAHRQRFMSTCSRRLQDLGIAASPALSPVDVYLQADTEYGWYDQGLPTGSFGSRNTHVLENCVISKNRARCPLFIDPDSIALNWCRGLSAKKGPDCVQLLSYGPGLLQKLKALIQEGSAVLCTILPRQFDPLLHALLQMRVLKKATADFLQIGPEMVEMGPGFSLMLRTSCDNLTFPSAVISRSTIINFRMEDEDFKDCALAMVVSAHNRRIQRERDDTLRLLVHRRLSVIRDRNAVIDKIMGMTADLADSIEVEKVTTFKTTVDAVRDRLGATERVMAQMASAAARCDSFALVLAALCPPVRSLRHLDGSYCFSAQELLHGFDLQLTDGSSGYGHEDEQPEQDESPSPEVLLGKEEQDSSEALNVYGVGNVNLDHLSIQSFVHLSLQVSHGMSDQHRKAFLVHSFFELQIARGTLAKEIYSTLLDVNVSTAEKLGFLSRHLEKLAQICSHLAEILQQNESPSRPSLADKSWQMWVDSKTPEELEVPGEEEQAASSDGTVLRLDSLEKMLLLCILRPDRLYAAVRNQLNRVLPRQKHLDNPYGGIEDVVLMQTSCNRDMHQADPQFLPSRLKYHALVPVLLVTSQDLLAWSDVLSVAGDRELLTADTPAQSRLVLSATDPDILTLLFGAAKTDSWVLVKDVALDPQFCEVVDEWLERLAHVELDEALSSPEDDTQRNRGREASCDSPDHPNLRITPKARSWALDCPEHSLKSTLLVPGGTSLPRPHPKFRLFLSTYGLTNSSSDSREGAHAPALACLYIKCLKINCIQAPEGIKAGYLKLSKNILRGRFVMFQHPHTFLVF